MNNEHEIVSQVYAAKADINAADELIRRYMGFIRSETAKFINRIPVEGRDDELSIAMMAFHEAVMSYEKIRGSFLKFASRAIKNRLIDYYRKEKRHRQAISLNTANDSEDDTELIDTVKDSQNEIEENISRISAQSEIAEFAKQLSEFGISFSDIADNCPKQSRTLDSCRRVLNCAIENPELLDSLVNTKKIPMAQLCEKSGVDRKTMERHRKYLVAVLLAFTNGYEIIRGHLSRIKNDERR